MRNAIIHHQTLSEQGKRWLVIAWAVEAGRAQATALPLENTVEEALVDTFLSLRAEYGTELNLYVGNRVVRDLLADASLPGLSLASTVASPAAQETWQRARRLFAGVLDSIRRPFQTTRSTTVTIATDASRGTRKSSGIAYVTSLGGLGTQMVQAANINVAEIEAIRFALNQVPGHIKDVTVLTDSKIAHYALSADSPHFAYGTQHQAQVTRALIERMKQGGIGVRIKWVRGHDGHALNEMADRLAVHARRCGEWNLGPTHRKFVAQLRTELRGLCAVDEEPIPGSARAGWQDDYLAVG